MELTTAVETKNETNIELAARSNLTRLQLLQWVGHRLRPDAPIFNTILTFRIHGAVDVARFKESFRLLVAESDALRTVVREQQGLPVQVVQPQAQGELDFLDFSSASDPEAVYQDWLQVWVKHPLMIEACLYATALVKLSEAEFVWVFNQHHMITDASAFYLAYDRLAQIYTNSLRTPPDDLPPMPAFADYVAYERSLRESKPAARAKQYWLGKLSPGPQALTIFGRPPHKLGSHVERRVLDLGIERSLQVRVRARQEGLFTITEDLSIYNVFAGLFSAVLAEISGNARLGFVTPVHNRMNETFRKTLGLVMELIPFQLELGQDDTYFSLIQKAKSETRETLAYAQFGSSANLSGQAFDVMFNMHHIPQLTLAGMPVTSERIHPGAGSESLALHVVDNDQDSRFELHFDFHSDVFSAGERQTVLEMFEKHLDAFLLDPGQPIFSRQVIRAQEAVQARTKASGPPVPPKDLLELSLLDVWKQLFNRDDIGVNDNFFDLGGNSWMAVRMFVEVEKVSGKYLPLTTLLNAATVYEIAEVLRSELGTDLWSTLITIKPGSRPPIYFAPGAGGNGLAVARIAGYLDKDQPVHMFQIPVAAGSSGEQSYQSIEAMAEHFVKSLRAVQPEGPYYLGGYSAGGIVIFEVAQQLHQQGQRVAFLGIIDVPVQSPSYRWLERYCRSVAQRQGWDEEKQRCYFLEQRDRLFRLEFFVKKGMRDTLRQKFSGLRRRLRGRKATGKAAAKGQRSRIPQSAVQAGDSAWRDYDRHMRGHFDLMDEAVRGYIPRRYAGKINLFRSVIGYRRPQMRMADPKQGWGKVTKSLEIEVIPGNHMEVVREPNVRLLGEKLNASLKKAQERFESNDGTH